MQTLSKQPCNGIGDTAGHHETEEEARRRNDRILREFVMKDPDQAIEIALEQIPGQVQRPMECPLARRQPPRRH